MRASAGPGDKPPGGSSQLESAAGGGNSGTGAGRMTTLQHSNNNERHRGAVGGQLQPSKSSNLSTLKKFDVLHRDKSQPEVLFRNGNDKNGRGLAGNNAATNHKPGHH